MSKKDVKDMTVKEIVHEAFESALILTVAIALLWSLSSIVDTSFDMSTMLHNFADKFKEVGTSLLKMFTIAFLVICSLLLIKKVIWVYAIYANKKLTKNS